MTDNPFMRVPLIRTAGISISVLSVFSGCQNMARLQEKAGPPNIIFIVSEDNSPFLGCYGDTNAYTPNIDKLASEGILYENAFSCAPVCAPSRSTIITGMYANSLGSHHMRSLVEIPESFHFFPYYLRQAGYYTANRIKKDYNIPDQEGVWDVDDWWEYKDMLKERNPDQPFFVMFNTFMSHESKIHGSRESMLNYYKNASIESMTGTPASEARVDSFNYMHEPGSIPLPPYHPSTSEMEEDWARYYDCISMMDDEVGELLKNLERDTLLENTIVFYFSDHGGVLGRSKRFTFESGLHVPLVIRIPEKFKHLAPEKPGTKTDRLVSLVDLAPTILNLAGIDLPEHFQGKPFLGRRSGRERQYAYSFRGRMDERYDFSRTVRSKEYRYIRNYMPHRIWGQHINYLWRAENVQSWEQKCMHDSCNSFQQRFWQTKSAEELYSLSADPHNINNLANDPAYAPVLKAMRDANDQWMLLIRDKNFIPEGEYLAHLADTNGFTYYSGNNFDIAEIKKTADMATAGLPENLSKLKTALTHQNPSIRYWGAVGCRILEEHAAEAKEDLLLALGDSSPDVSIASAEALYFLDEREEAMVILQSILSNTEMHPFSAMEMVRTHALNVVDLMEPEDIAFFAKEIIYLANREQNGYDKRVAEYMLTRGIF